jgi:hypothetical protein
MPTYIPSSGDSTTDITISTLETDKEVINFFAHNDEFNINTDYITIMKQYDLTKNDYIINIIDGINKISVEKVRFPILYGDISEKNYIIIYGKTPSVPDANDNDFTFKQFDIWNNPFYLTLSNIVGEKERENNVSIYYSSGNSYTVNSTGGTLYFGQALYNSIVKERHIAFFSITETDFKDVYIQNDIVPKTRIYSCFNNFTNVGVYEDFFNGVTEIDTSFYCVNFNQDIILNNVTSIHNSFNRVEVLRNVEIHNSKITNSFNYSTLTINGYLFIDSCNFNMPNYYTSFNKITVKGLITQKNMSNMTLFSNNGNEPLYYDIIFDTQSNITMLLLTNTLTSYISIKDSDTNKNLSLTTSGYETTGNMEIDFNGNEIGSIGFNTSSITSIVKNGKAITTSYPGKATFENFIIETYSGTALFYGDAFLEIVENIICSYIYSDDKIIDFRTLSHLNSLTITNRIVSISDVYTFYVDKIYEGSATNATNGASTIYCTTQEIGEDFKNRFKITNATIILL